MAAVSLPRAYEDGEMLFLQGDRAEGFFVVGEGHIRVCRLGRDGREQTLHRLGAGEVCGEVPVFQGGRYPATAMAEGDLTALYVPGDAFLALAEEEPGLLLEMLAVLARRLRRFVDLVDDLALKEISARVAKHLLDLRVRQAGETVRLETAKQALAARLGTVAETLSRTLGKMQKRGIVAVEGRTVRILDRDGLDALAAGAKL